MRLMVILVVVLIIGLLVQKQLGQSSAQKTQEIQQQQSTTEVPKVPTNADDIQQFESDMNSFMQQEAEKQKAAIDKAVNQ